MFFILFFLDFISPFMLWWEAIMENIYPWDCYNLTGDDFWQNFQLFSNPRHVRLLLFANFPRTRENCTYERSYWPIRQERDRQTDNIRHIFHQFDFVLIFKLDGCILSHRKVCILPYTIYMVIKQDGFSLRDSCRLNLIRIFYI